MLLIEAIILGLVQGLTEFLPVSSSGHLVIFQDLLGLNDPGLTMEVILHFGTLLSVFTVFGRDFIDLLRFSRDDGQRRYLLMLVAGVIPTGVIGLLLERYMEIFFSSTLIVGAMLLLTGGMLKFMEMLPPGKKDAEKMEIRDALWIGLMQGIAVIPGISRSGATITAAIWRGLDRTVAVRYSFMLSAPVIFGATLLEVKDMVLTGVERTMLLNYIVGGAVAFLAGIVAIKTFIKLLKDRKFHYFAYYCWAAGISILLFLFLRN